MGQYIVGGVTILLVSVELVYSPLFLRKYWRSLVFCNFCIVVDTDNQFVAQGLGLPKGVCVAKMHHIVAKRGRER
jgi:hypothetical protein